jgi:hypothetical protein
VKLPHLFFSADSRVGEEVLLRQCRDRLAAVAAGSAAHDPRAASAPVSRKSSQLSSKMVLLSHQKEEEEVGWST